MNRVKKNYHGEFFDASKPQPLGLKGKSTRVILCALSINVANLLLKTIAWLWTGSHSMFAESMHSLADTINHLILAYAINKSVQSPDNYHPYGYKSMIFVSTMTSGVVILCISAGLSFYRGVDALLDKQIEHDLDYGYAYIVLLCSFVSDITTLILSTREILRASRERGHSFKEYVLLGEDPRVNVMLVEDSASVVSIIVAACCLTMSTTMESTTADAIGSIIISLILASVALFLIYTNAAALVKKSIPRPLLESINLHQIEFNGKELSELYLNKLDLGKLFRIVKSLENVEQLKTFMLFHGENIVDSMGMEIDRIELYLRQKFPKLRHLDLEVL